MKRTTLTIFLLSLITCAAMAQNNVGINDNSSSPKASAMLDVYSTTKGLLIPRIALTSTTSASPVTSPETSLLIYNTATTSDVTPGYYYWNGSKWVRLVASADPSHINIVEKTSNATLQKTENMVFATGFPTGNTLTLTLPVITSTDDGLEITIKHAGTYLDLLMILPQGGHTIDGESAAFITKGCGLTFVAKGSEWFVKEKIPILVNVLNVTTGGSFTTLSEAIEFLNLHMSSPTTIILGGGSYEISSTISINLPEPLTIEGISYGQAYLYSTTSGSAMFNCETETYFKMLDFQGAGSTTGTDALILSGSEEYYEIKDCTFHGFDKGVTQTSNNELWLFEVNFDSCATAGLEIAAGTASDGATNLSESDFSTCGKGVSLLSGAAWTFGMSNCNIYGSSSGEIGVYYNPTNFTNFSFISICNNGWNNVGSFISGFDFSRTDGRDANAYIMSNYGLESLNPHFRINVLNNASTTTLTTANSWYKASWTTTSQTTCSWLLVNNKATYLPVNKRDVAMWISGNLSVNNSSRTINMGVVKNGVTSVRYGETTLRTPSSSSNQPYQFSTVVYLENVSPGDYFEFYVSSTTSGDILKVQDINWFSDSK